MATTNTNEKKFKELILYVTNKCFKSPNWGALKLNKILFYSEFLAYARLGTPITGVEFRRYTYGPAPAKMKYFKRDLESANAVYEYSHPPAGGFSTMHRELMPMREAILEGFSGNEISIVDDIIRDCWNLSGSELSNYTHGLTGWRVAKDDEMIPHFIVLIPDGNADVEYSSKDLAWCRSVADRITRAA